jgi:hypothetical protein
MTAERMACHLDLADKAWARAEERTQLVRDLRDEGQPSFDRITGGLLEGMGRAGVFRWGGTLVGSSAFRRCTAELGVGPGDTDPQARCQCNPKADRRRPASGTQLATRGLGRIETAGAMTT